MYFSSSSCAVVVVATLLISGVYCKLPETDSFDESFEESGNVSSELRKALIPAEDAFIGFINKLVNTGYSSSKIAINRIEKASQKRRQFGDQLEQLLARLPTYSSEVEIENQMPRALKHSDRSSPPVPQK